jgi:hypothetical protein
MVLTNKVYDVTKALAQIILPALGALYFAVAEIWKLPDAQQVVGTITVVDTFLGGILAASSASYKPSTDGNVVVHQDSDGKKTVSLQLAVPPEQIVDKVVSSTHLTFGVDVRPPSEPANTSAMTE